MSNRFYLALIGTLVQLVFAPSKGDLYMKMARAVPPQFHNKIYQHYSN